MAKTAKKKTIWTEAEVFKKLSGPFPSPAFITLPQVRNGTGYSRRRVRTADAIIASVWPSRGLYLAGVEIKVTRSDWRRELADAEKSVDIQRYCRYWYVAAPEGIIPVGEVPPTWGLIEVSARGCKTMKAAPELTPSPIDMAFLCSVLRSASETSVPYSEVQATIDERCNALKDTLERQHERNRDSLRDAVRRFQEASGLDISNQWAAGNIGEAVKTVMASQHLDLAGQIRSLANHAKRIKQAADKALAEIGNGESEGEWE